MEPIRRLPDWPERLAAFIEERRHVPFEWGRNDCATFAADALLAITGVDVLGQLRGQWAAEDRALAVAARLHGMPMAARRLLGRPLPQVALAPRGAVVCARMGALPIMGVLAGARWCAPGADGLQFRPGAEIRLAWGV